MPSALPVPPATPAEEWEFLEWNVLKPSRTGSVCITCQHFRYEVGRHCVTLLTCPIHQGLIPQGEHLTKRCSQWVARQEGQSVLTDLLGAEQKVWVSTDCPRCGSSKHRCSHFSRFLTSLKALA